MLPNQKYLIVVKWNKRVKYGSKLKDIDDYVKRLIYRCLVTDFPVANYNRSAKSFTRQITMKISEVSSK